MTSISWISSQSKILILITDWNTHVISFTISQDKISVHGLLSTIFRSQLTPHNSFHTTKLYISLKRAMKFFQLVQIKCSILGIAPNQYPFNRKILMAFLLYGIAISCLSLFILRVANDFIEIANGMYQVATMIFGVVCVTNFAFRMAKFFEFIESCERIVNKSKSIWYSELNPFHRLIEPRWINFFSSFDFRIG